MAAKPVGDADVVERKLPLGEHFAELRVRVLHSLIALFLAFGVCVARWSWIYDIIAYPHRRAMSRLGLPPVFQQIGYFEYVLSLMKACLVVALLIASPFVMYQAWAFVAAGLYRNERRYVTRTAPFVFGAFLVGIVFGYLVLLPYGFEFVIRLRPASVIPQIRIGEYVNLFFLMTFMLGIVFQTPLLLLVAERINVVSTEDLIKHRRYAIVGAFLVGAILTPSPDCFSQSLVAGPIIFLYEIGILLIAPTRRNFYVFFRGVAVALLAVGAISTALKRWPVAYLQTETPPGSQRPAPTRRLAKNAKITTDESEIQTVGFGRKSSQRLMVGPSSSVSIQSRDAVLLESGEILLTGEPKETKPLSVLVDVLARVDCTGEGEIRFSPQTGLLRVTVMSGEFRIEVGKREHVVKGGRTFSLNLIGSPADLDALRTKWKLAPGGSSDAVTDKEADP